MARFRSTTVGMIFQSFNLIGSRSAVENVELPMVFAGRSPRSDRRGPGALEAVGLGAIGRSDRSRFDSKPLAMSHIRPHSVDRSHLPAGFGWLGSRLKPNDRPAARVCGNPTLYVEAVVKR